MLRQLGNILILTLAINFIAVAAAVGWLRIAGHLNAEKVAAIGEILFPAESLDTPDVQVPVTAAVDEPPPLSTAAAKLEQLLHRHAHLPATEQVRLIQQSFDAQLAEAERRERDLRDLHQQLEMARQQIARDRGELQDLRHDLEQRAQQQEILARDGGFQDTLQLYSSMPARQVKSIFMNLDEPTAAQYLQSMDARAASRIVGQFRTPEELRRVQRILEHMRHPEDLAG